MRRLGHNSPVATRRLRTNRRPGQGNWHERHSLADRLVVGRRRDALGGRWGVFSTWVGWPPEEGVRWPVGRRGIKNLWLRDPEDWGEEAIAWVPEMCLAS